MPCGVMPYGAVPCGVMRCHALRCCRTVSSCPAVCHVRAGHLTATIDRVTATLGVEITAMLRQDTDMLGQVTATFGQVTATIGRVTATLGVEITAMLGQDTDMLG